MRSFVLPYQAWRGVRVVEGARLESVYTPKGYRGFESLPLRNPKTRPTRKRGVCFFRQTDQARLRRNDGKNKPRTLKGDGG